MSIRLQVRTQTATVVLAQAGGYLDPAGRFRIAVYSEGVDMGNPEHRTVTVPWQGIDGDRVETTGHGNRQQTYQVKVESLTGDDAGLVAGEAYVGQVVGARAELWWQAPSAANATVYDVETSRMDWAINDDLELGVEGDGTVPVRVFTLVLTCQPFGRRPEPTVIPAVSSGSATGTVTPTVTVVYDGTSIAGWKAGTKAPWTDLGVRAASGGGVENTVLPKSGRIGGLYAPTGLSVAMGTDRYLAVTFNAAPKGTPHLIVTWGGTTRTLYPNALLGATAYYLLPTTGLTLTGLRWLVLQGQRYTIRSIARQNVLPYLGNARQSTTAFLVPGTARTGLSVRVRHSRTLGDVVLYARAEDGSGNQPPMRVHRTLASQGTVATDTAAITGAGVTITPGQYEYYEPPASQMPEGPYMALLRHKPGATGVTFNLQVSTIVGTSVLGTWQSGAMWRDGLTAGVYANSELGLVSLPTVRVPPGVVSTARVQIRLSASATTTIDELWLFDMQRGRVIRVNAGGGGTTPPVVGGVSNCLMIDAPSMTSTRQAIYVGTNLNRTDARHASSAAIGQRQRLVAEPGLMNVFIASAQEYPSMEFEFYERGIHHPGGGAS